jgi:hypothetical protein
MHTKPAKNTILIPGLKARYRILSTIWMPEQIKKCRKNRRIGYVFQNRTFASRRPANKDKPVEVFCLHLIVTSLVSRRGLGKGEVEARGARPPVGIFEQRMPRRAVLRN